MHGSLECEQGDSSIRGLFFQEFQQLRDSNLSSLQTRCAQERRNPFRAHTAGDVQTEDDERRVARLADSRRDRLLTGRV